MKYLSIIFLSLVFMGFGKMEAQVPSSKAVHKEMHSRLLANAKNSIDKSVIEEYIKAEFELREAPDPQFAGLSAESIEMIADLLQEARSHSGKRYRSGAKGPNNFDCSGFTSYVYNQFGYTLNPSSGGQFSNGVKVEDKDLRPGDLVFFTGRNSKGGVGHVGIVVDVDSGDGTFNFIHAATSSGIQIDRSIAPYYKKRYLGARRIITE